MNEEQLKSQLRRGYREAPENSRPPEFDTVWAAAQVQAERRAPWGTLTTGRAAGLAAGFAVLGVIGLFALGQRQGSNELPDGWTAQVSDSLLNATVWSAPSDVLLQRDGLDVYTNVPMLIESTEMEVETLL